MSEEEEITEDFEKWYDKYLQEQFYANGGYDYQEEN